MRIATFILATALAFSSAQDFPECECGMFITYYGEERLVHTLPPFSVDNCDATLVCKNLCAKEFNALTGSGDLNHVMDNGYTVGQELCLYALINQDLTELTREKVYGYARHCKGPWDYDGVSTINELCCWNGRYLPCGDL